MHVHDIVTVQCFVSQFMSMQQAAEDTTMYKLFAPVLDSLYNPIQYLVRATAHLIALPTVGPQTCKCGTVPYSSQSTFLIISPIIIIITLYAYYIDKLWSFMCNAILCSFIEK